MTVLVIGSTCVDVTIRIRHLPSVEEDIIPKWQSFALGGCAYNVASVLALTDTPHTLFSPVGTGLYGNFVRERLTAQGTPPFLFSDEENGCCYCLVDEKGDRTFMAVHGGEYHFRREWFDALDMGQYEAVYVCGLEIEEESGEMITSFLEDHPVKRLYFAAGPRVGSIRENLLQRINGLNPLFHVNLREYQTLTEILGQEPRYAIVTDGAKPVMLKQKEKKAYVDTVPGEQYDGVGAGDAHCGSVIAFTEKGDSLTEAIRKANIIASATLNKAGGPLTETEFARLLF